MRDITKVEKFAGPEDRYYDGSWGTVFLRCVSCETPHTESVAGEKAKNPYELCVSAKANGWKLFKYHTFCSVCKTKLLRCWARTFSAVVFVPVGRFILAGATIAGRYI